MISVTSWVVLAMYACLPVCLNIYELVSKLLRHQSEILHTLFSNQDFHLSERPISVNYRI